MKIFPKNWRIALIRTGCVIFLLVIVRLFLFQWFQTFGMSMEPTIHDGSIVFVNKMAYRIKPVQRGDIIVFRTSNKPYVYFVKRVIAFSGETVEFKNGILFIDGKQIDEPYIYEKGNWNVNPFVVKENKIFVCGDNRLIAWENHFHPQISMKNITGKVIGYR
ncbi:MAG: signal peptidase I [Candidatus Omnitrophica bacterium]|nr:signal peptidase I [Candidatus Omnitrophota bacterium]